MIWPSSCSRPPSAALTVASRGRVRLTLKASVPGWSVATRTTSTSSGAETNASRVMVALPLRKLTRAIRRRSRSSRR